MTIGGTSRTALRWLFATATGVCALFFVASLGETLHSLAHLKGQTVPFTVGAVAGGLVYRTLFRGEFFRTFEHELTHLIFALAFFHKPTWFQVHHSGNGEMASQGTPNVLISLAPYFFPTLVLPPIALSWLLRPQFLPCAYVLAGFAFAYHIGSTAQEFSFAQPDIRKSGIALSVVLVAALNVLLTGAILADVARGPREPIRVAATAAGRIVAIATPTSSLDRRAAFPARP